MTLVNSADLSSAFDRVEVFTSVASASCRTKLITHNVLDESTDALDDAKKFASVSRQGRSSAKLVRNCNRTDHSN